MKPTDEQIRKFWQWCGFKYANWQSLDGIKQYHYPDLGMAELPDLDLNNLFKYAVPKLDYPVISFYFDDATWFCSLVEGCLRRKHKASIRKNGEDPTLALFWAIWEVIKERVSG